MNKFPINQAFTYIQIMFRIHSRMDDAYEDPDEVVDFFKREEAANAAWENITTF